MSLIASCWSASVNNRQFLPLLNSLCYLTWTFLSLVGLWSVCFLDTLVFMVLIVSVTMHHWASFTHCTSTFPPTRNLPLFSPCPASYHPLHVYMCLEHSFLWQSMFVYLKSKRELKGNSISSLHVCMCSCMCACVASSKLILPRWDFCTFQVKKKTGVVI